MRDEQPLRTSCLFCDWVFIGLAGEGRQAALAHREEHHPEAAVKRPRKVRRITATWQRSDADREQITLDAAEANRVRAEREDAERLEKVLRARAREAA